MSGAEIAHSRNIVSHDFADMEKFLFIKLFCLYISNIKDYVLDTKNMLNLYIVSVFALSPLKHYCIMRHCGVSQIISSGFIVLNINGQNEKD
jgi:hypothetical protein